MRLIKKIFIDLLFKINEEKALKFISALGNDHLDRGNFKAGIFYFDNLVVYNPKKIEYRYKRGTCYYHLSEYQLALSDYNKCLKILAFNSKIKKDVYYFARGLVYFKIRKYEDAMKDFDICFEKYQHLEALIHKGMCKANLNKLDEALIDYNKAEDLGADSSVLFNQRGLALFKLKMLDKALLDVNTSITKYGSDFSKLYNRGLIHFKNEDWTLALSDFESVLGLCPNHTNALIHKKDILKRI
jgi:tetratricopeptide (TPR) repeat protein